MEGLPDGQDSTGGVAPELVGTHVGRYSIGVIPQWQGILPELLRRVALMAEEGLSGVLADVIRPPPGSICVVSREMKRKEKKEKKEKEKEKV